MQSYTLPEDGMMGTMPGDQMALSNRRSLDRAFAIGRPQMEVAQHFLLGFSNNDLLSPAQKAR